MRKFLSLLLSLCLIASLSISAFAADDFGSDPSVDSMDGAEILNITVPDEILLHMNQDGSVQVAQTHVIQNHSQGDVCVKSIDVSGCDDWRVVAFDSDLSSFDANTHVLALSFRGDGTCDTGSVVLSDDNWVIARDSSLPINVSVNMPEQSASDKSKIAMISWDVDWVDSDGSIYPIEVPVFDSEHGQSDIDRVLTDESGRIPVFPNVIPDEGYLFDTWVDQDNNPVDGTTVFTPDDSIRPVFKPDPDYRPTEAVVVPVLPSDNGSCVVDSVTTELDGCIQVYPDVTPAAGYMFDKWVDRDGNPVDGDTVFNSGDAIQPVFKVIEYLPFTITDENRSEIGFSDETSRLVIPAQFQGSDGLYYMTVAIGRAAFRNCENITSVVIPNTVTEIGSLAFADCVNYTGKCVIPNSVVSVGSSAFANTDVRGIQYSTKMTEIPDSCFAQCKNLDDFRIPAYITKIGRNAFGFTGLTEAVVPDTVTYLGDYCFDSCVNLQRVVFSKSCDTVPQGVCRNNSSLTSVSIPSNVTIIKQYAFQCWESFRPAALSSITLPSGLKTIEQCAFDHCGVSYLYVPSSVIKISNQSFDGIDTVRYSGTARPGYGTQNWGATNWEK